MALLCLPCQHLALAATLAGADPDAVLNVGYFSVGFVFVAMSIYTCIFLVRKDNVPGANLDAEIKLVNKTASQILRENWKSLIPVMFLIVVVACRSFSFIGIDLGPLVLQNIKFAVKDDATTVTTNLYNLLSSTTILKGCTNGVVTSIGCAIIFSLV